MLRFNFLSQHNYIVRYEDMTARPLGLTKNLEFHRETVERSAIQVPLI